jgi:four helix bundle protein
VKRNENDGNNVGNGNHGNNGKQAFHNSHDSQNSRSNEPTVILPPRGDYHILLSYQKAEVIYEITYRFCKRFLARGDRTIDQMVQAARSGKQNIIEGSKAAVTSKETEIKLTNVARASLEELLGGCPRIAIFSKIEAWPKKLPEAYG